MSFERLSLYRLEPLEVVLSKLSQPAHSTTSQTVWINYVLILLLSGRIQTGQVLAEDGSPLLVGQEWAAGLEK